MTKRIHTLTPLVGGAACNARCQFCIAGMTPLNTISSTATALNTAEFARVCQYALAHDAASLLYTSKGEPTLWPDQLTEYLQVSSRFAFPSVELQTNGIPIADAKKVNDSHLKEWRRLGLSMVAISITSYDAEKDHKTYLPYRSQYIDLPKLIAKLHGHGLQVRLACVMVRGNVDSPAELDKLMAFAGANEVEQLTVRPVNKPAVSRDDKITVWISNNYLLDDQKQALVAHLDSNGTLLKKLPWGGRIYDVNGQNVCYTNSLTKDDDADVGRQLIFFPDGFVSDSWENNSQSLDDFKKNEEQA
jgi:MoaA/NifB/PqqE/SkfB family radical SAM enzyme